MRAVDEARGRQPRAAKRGADGSTAGPQRRRPGGLPKCGQPCRRGGSSECARVSDLFCRCGWRGVVGDAALRLRHPPGESSERQPQPQSELSRSRTHPDRPGPPRPGE